MAATRLVAVVLAMLLAVTMLPAAGIQSAFADEPIARPVTTGGDTTLEGYAAESAPVAMQWEDGMYVADGLVYAVTDGGLSLVGFDGLPQGEDAAKDITVPASVLVDSKDTSVVAVDIAEGQVVESIVLLTLPQSINNVNTATLAGAFPNLASVEVAVPKASAPVAAGAAAIRAAYSSFGGVLYRNAWVAADGDASQATLVKELVWVPPATVVARIPAECASIASGAFADVKNLKTVVCFGVMGEIPQAKKAGDGTVTSGAFTDEQIATVNVIVPQTGTVVSDGERVSASVAVTDDSTMDIKREAWWKSGFASDRITLGEVCGSMTNTLPVTEEGTLEVAEAEVAYAPETTQNSSSRKAGIEPPESAIPIPVPDDDSIDPSESGLVFTHLADMTLSVSWKGDPTATPTHLDIPAYATINGVTYPVTEIAPEAFKGAVFLTSITIPETVKTIGESAFEGCANLADPDLSSTAKEMFGAALNEASTLLTSPERNAANPATPFREPKNNLPSTVRAVDAEPIESYSAKTTLTVYTLDSWGRELKVLTASSGKTSGDFSVPYTSTQSSVTFDTSSLSGPCVTAAFSTTGEIGLFQSLNYDGTSCNWTKTGLSAPANYRIGYIGGSLSGPAPAGSLKSSVASIGVVCSQLYAKSDNPSISVYYFGEDDISSTLGRMHQALSSSMLQSVYTKASADAVFASRDWTSENFLTKAATELDNFYDKAAFNTISYTGLEDASYTGALPTFYVNDASKLPTVPEPKRDGYEFKGWTWGSETTPSRDASGAFSSGGPVALTAVWEEAEPETPEATHFFTGERPLRFDDASERQTHVIKVRLSNVPRTLASVSFEGDDRTHLLKGTSGVELYVASAEDAFTDGTRLAWGGSTHAGWTCELAELADGSYGVYVGISVPTSAIDESAVPVSYTDGSYVASLVKMNYTFA